LSVGTTQAVFGVVIIVVLVLLGTYYAWRQWQTLRGLRTAAGLPPDEFRYVRNQAWRRLAGAALMLVFAALFAGLLYLEGPANSLVQAGEEAHARNDQAGMNPEQKQFFHFYTAYVIVLLLVLLALIALAGYELFAIRRYSLHHLRQIQAERRAMIKEETARIRAERNGPG
jgi:hypothetical protein